MSNSFDVIFIIILLLLIFIALSYLILVMYGNNRSNRNQLDINNLPIENLLINKFVMSNINYIDSVDIDGLLTLSEEEKDIVIEMMKVKINQLNTGIVYSIAIATFFLTLNLGFLNFGVNELFIGCSLMFSIILILYSTISSTRKEKKYLKVLTLVYMSKITNDNNQNNR